MKASVRNLTIASLTAITMCIPFVMDFEGNEPVGYADPIGIPTAGYGHTGSDVIIGKWYSEAQTKGWLKEDLSDAASTVEKCAPSSIDVFQRAAFISFAFNVGPGKKGVKDGFCVLKSGKQPSHLRYAFAGNKEKSCNALLAWNKAGGKVLKGLTRRRIAERDLCMRTE